jgi:hypothetical protein
VEPSKRIDWIINAVKQYNFPPVASKAVAIITGTESDEPRLRKNHEDDADIEILGGFSEPNLSPNGPRRICSQCQRFKDTDTPS